MMLSKRKIIISCSLILTIIAVSAVVIFILLKMGFGKTSSDKNKTDISISTDSIVDSIISEFDYNGISRISSDNVSRYYDIDESLISEATVYVSSSEDSCFEVSCFKLNDETDYSQVEEKIKNHINSQSTNFQILNPKESRKLDSTKIEYCAPYVLVVVADNSESAVTSFKSLVKGTASSDQG